MINNFTKYIAAFLIFIILSFTSYLFPEENNPEQTDREKASPEQIEIKRGDSIYHIPKDLYYYLINRPEEMMKYLQRMEYYRQAEEELNSIIVFVAELPADNRNNIYAPIFMTKSDKIFGTITDFSFKWVGYKTTLDFKQKGFPWKNMTLSETIIGSFLYASGTNIGFNRGKLEEESRFYTNYFSEILTLKIKLPFYTSAAFALDSRQYFFVERETSENFTMPLNHYNIFPRIDLGIGYVKEDGIDQLTSGIELFSWAGYGIRNRWEEWGEPGDMQTGEKARTFLIYSSKLTAGLLFRKNHNLVLRAHYKGGTDNDFLSQPRFGGTIDNADIDAVHGFTLDQFRVKKFGLANLRYGFNIIERLRFNLFLDYARIFSPDTQNIFGSGYGFRIIAWGGLPIWLTHGMGKIITPEKKAVDHVFMIMTAAGW
ncbi:MAG: hypothetical protein JW864_17110 [Spirochaetes bacterium]|nr:hypothetical protein [Spirochaetota bacterium]